MTDKQKLNSDQAVSDQVTKCHSELDSESIIIDCVDVSRCVYHEDGYCTISKQAYCYCCDKPNCHYKNWQRKEQELNKAKQVILQAIKDFSFEYGTPQYDRLLNGAKSLKIEGKDYE